MTCLAIGEHVYCPAEFWSGEVADITADEYTGEPVMIIRSHGGPLLQIRLAAYMGLIRSRKELH